MKWSFEISDTPSNMDYPIIAHQTFDNGIKKGPFYLTVDNLISALSMELEVSSEIEWDSTPLLPKGTVQYKTSKNNTHEEISLDIPKKIWEIRYLQNDNFYSIGFPRLIANIRIANRGESKQITKMKLFAVLDNGKPITSHTELYKFPFPNVFEDGTVCFGQNSIPKINELVELERIFQWFIAAPFNEELGVRTTHGIPKFEQLINVIKNQTFNDDWLVPTNQVFHGV